MMRWLSLLLILTVPVLAASPRPSAAATVWRAATQQELEGLIPARAPVEKERIETEMRTASGITDGHGKYVAGVVLITAGYSAEGKYSHYFITQVPIRIGSVALSPGEYVFGWKRAEDHLDVKFYEAASGRFEGDVEAHRADTGGRIESFRIVPPNAQPVIQIGRFNMPYQLAG